MFIYLSLEQASLPFDEVNKIIRVIKKAKGYSEINLDYKGSDDEIKIPEFPKYRNTKNMDTV